MPHMNETRFGSSEIERLRLDDEDGHSLLGARFVLLARLPEHRLAGVDRLALPVGSADPPRPAHNGEELGADSRVPGDDSFRADLDHDDVRVPGQALHPRAHAPGRRRSTLAVELDPPQMRSITDAIAWPNPMHIVATP